MMIKQLSISAIFLAFYVSGQSMAQTETPEGPAAADTPAASEPSMLDQFPAPTKWEICNETSFSLRLAYAELVDEKPGGATGWKRLRAGSCLTTDIDNGNTKFLYAKSSKAHRGGIREWKGTAKICTRETDFQSDPTIGCALQNMTVRDYMPIASDEAVTTLVEIENFKTKAAAAGIQRLLQDNGYDISRVDGLVGRRTSRTLSQFLKDNDVPGSAGVEEQLDALEKAAEAKVKTVGLTLCNRSSAEVWASIGLRRKGNWESRGWWKIDAENCKQVYTESLIAADLSFYVTQEGGIGEEGEKMPDKAMRSAAAKPTQFCISDAKFSVLGRENCADYGYNAANFRVVPADKDGLTVDLTDADFAEPSASGLRQ